MTDVPAPEPARAKIRTSWLAAGLLAAAGAVALSMRGSPPETPPSTAATMPALPTPARCPVEAVPGTPWVRTTLAAQDTFALFEDALGRIHAVAPLSVVVFPNGDPAEATVLLDVTRATCRPALAGGDAPAVGWMPLDGACMGPSGELWLTGGKDRLFRLRGTELTAFDPPPGDRLYGRRIAIHEGRVVAATSEGVATLDAETGDWSALPRVPDLPVRHLLGTRDGGLWVGSGSTVFRLEAGEWRSVLGPVSLEGVCLRADDAGHALVSLRQEAHVFDAHGVRLERLASSGESIFGNVAGDLAGECWIADPQGWISHRTRPGEEWRTVASLRNVSGRGCAALLRDRRGLLWCSLGCWGALPFKGPRLYVAPAQPPNALLLPAAGEPPIDPAGVPEKVVRLTWQGKPLSAWTGVAPRVEVRPHAGTAGTGTSERTGDRIVLRGYPPGPHWISVTVDPVSDDGEYAVGGFHGARSLDLPLTGDVELALERSLAVRSPWDNRQRVPAVLQPTPAPTNAWEEALVLENPVSFTWESLGAGVEYRLSLSSRDLDGKGRQAPASLSRRMTATELTVRLPTAPRGVLYAFEFTAWRDEQRLGQSSFGYRAGGTNSSLMFRMKE